MFHYLRLSKQKGLTFALRFSELWLGQFRLQIVSEFHARVPRA